MDVVFGKEVKVSLLKESPIEYSYVENQKKESFLKRLGTHLRRFLIR